MKDYMATLTCVRVKKNSGFTLVELAIVLVIIGLIIGGVLVGQDLIKAAEIRATISQIESYNTAVSTFRGRFKGVPGDLRNATSFIDATQWTNLQNGDGDRQVESCSIAGAGHTPAAANGLCATNFRDGVRCMNGERTQFWYHLSAAQLIKGSYDGLSGTVTATGGLPNGPGTVGVSFPRAAIDRNGIGVYTPGLDGSGYDGRGNLNTWFHLGATTYGTPGADFAAYAPSFTPEEAFKIDSKVDDGRPNTGGVMASASVNTVGDVPIGAGPTSAVASTAADTVTTAAGYSALFCGVGTVITAVQYAVLNPAVACQLRMRMN